LQKKWQEKKQRVGQTGGGNKKKRVSCVAKKKQIDISYQ
jgi:hypothetical protein